MKLIPHLKWMFFSFASFYFSSTSISQNITYPSQQKSILQISAHRGNASSAPENTLAAFKNALQVGADFIEVDVRTTNDGVLMIMHDANLERTTNGKGAFKLYDAAYLKTLSAGKGFTGVFENEKIPTLEETCQLISDWNASHQHKTHLYIDAKDVEPQPLVAILKKYGLDENAVYYGSDDFLWRLTSVFQGAKLLPALKNKTDIMAKFNKLKPYAFDASWLSLTKEMVDEIHRLGVKVFTDLLGPLDTEINYIKASEMGVDLIQTDRILVVQKTLSMH
jgi:glycerophosphoryl diester phosphodiesterase